METNKIPARADVPEKDKWAIQDLFATDDDWRAALTRSYTTRSAAAMRTPASPRIRRWSAR